ncbi:MAG TPA: hypothetical protein VMT16_01755 [Thermoanaerobaculia bacterium]|nr:hypothetical protein [Thermoanaerobaculia bacterium]
MNRLASRHTRLLGAGLLAAASLAAQAPAEPAAPAAASPLQLVAVSVTPPAPGPDTLCQLRVTLRNDGDRQISQLAFAVAVNGHDLPVYGNQLFMDAIPPGGEAEVRLYNFWSTETGRPAPADGKYRVEVTLREAHWYRIEMEEDVEVWTPLGEVPGLPVRAAAAPGEPPARPAGEPGA